MSRKRNDSLRSAGLKSFFISLLRARQDSPHRAAHGGYNTGQPIHVDMMTKLLTLHHRSKTSPRDGHGVVRVCKVASLRRVKPAQLQGARLPTDGDCWLSRQVDHWEAEMPQDSLMAASGKLHSGTLFDATGRFGPLTSRPACEI